MTDSAAGSAQRDRGQLGGERGAPASRAPAQERGRRRMDAILDAAAALVAELGTGAVTVQAIAQRAGASKGSMYHFFPDRESMFVALAERHVRSLGEALQAARERAPARASGEVEAAVDAFLHPVQDYLEQHPDLRRLLNEPANLERLATQRAALGDLVEGHAEWVVRQRHPRLTSAQASLVAASMVAVLSAMRSERVLSRGRGSEVGRAETRRLLAAYLASYQP